jgi:iron complex transport system ATP-binding protein
MSGGSCAIISLRNLQFSYDGSGRRVLHDLSLEIPDSAVTAILGPNGCGKTTLLHVLLGILHLQGGTIHFDGRLRDELTRREVSRLLGLVPQDEHTPFEFTVGEYVLLGRAPHLGLLQTPGDADRIAAARAIEDGGLGALRERILTTLSGGERQLAVLARSLAQGPRILLLDEPIAHLDLANRARILEVVRGLVSRRAAIVMTTHDPNAASAVADHVVLLRDGRVMKEGPAADALTAEHLSKTYGIPVEVEMVRGRPMVITAV